MSARFLVGDVFERMAELPDGSVDLVLTSPPFLALRSYLPADHPDKAKEIGSEATPAEFLDTLLALTAEWRRVLASHGSIAVELGDTYSGSGGAGGDYGPGGLREGQERFDGSASKAFALGAAPRPARKRSRYPEGRAAQDRTNHIGGSGWPMEKSLCGIPHLYAWSLAYGRNLLTGEPSPAGLWRVRNVVAWCRPNPPVGALGDKFRPATSYLTIATVARDRYFDLDAVRTPLTEPGAVKRKAKNHSGANPRSGWESDNAEIRQNENGAPPLDWWEIPTQPYAGSHYATWPSALCKRPIEAMCPQKVCTVCGEPSRRITLTEQVPTRATNGRKAYPDRGSMCENFDHQRTEARVKTVGWSDCRCLGGPERWRRGIVLDPFAGSGTTLAVATGLGRDAIGIDLDERNVDLARERVGMFLDVDSPVSGSSESVAAGGGG